MSLPHLKNSTAGRNKYDPVHNSLFEVYFTLPEALRADFAQDEALITEHVQKVTGLEALDKGPETVTQNFMGTTRTFLKPHLGETSANMDVELSLNLRNNVDNYIYRLFKAWQKLGYDIETGAINLKKDYCADWLRIVESNRAGDIIRDITFKDVIMHGNIEGQSEFDYSTDDPVAITVHFASDWWNDNLASNTAS